MRDKGRPEEIDIIISEIWDYVSRQTLTPKRKPIRNKVEQVLGSPLWDEFGDIPYEISIGSRNV